jgi:hypothetical protein
MQYWAEKPVPDMTDEELVRAHETMAQHASQPWRTDKSTNNWHEQRMLQCRAELLRRLTREGGDSGGPRE